MLNNKVPRFHEDEKTRSQDHGQQWRAFQLKDGWFSFQTLFGQFVKI